MAEDVFRDIIELTNEAWQSGDLKLALRGLELQGKHLGMFRERVELDNNFDLAVALREGQERAERLLAKYREEERA